MPSRQPATPASRHGLHVSTAIFLVFVASLVAVTIGSRLGGEQPDPSPDQADSEPMGDLTTMSLQRDRQRDDGAPSSLDDPPAVSAEAIIAIDADTGDVLYAENADEQRDIGSTVKIVTALVVRDHAEPDAEVTVNDSDLVDPMVYSNMALQPGDTLTVQQLLEGLLVPSGSDGANALARYVGGLIDPSAADPVAAFVSVMNDKAIDLGMTNTVFANPHGNDAEGAHSTARDLAIAAKALLADPVLAEIVAMPEYSFTSVGPEAREYRAQSTNKLLTEGDPGILGVKSGSTESAGGCLVLAFDPGDRSPVILVTLGSDLAYEGDWISVDARWDDARSLVAWLEESTP